MEDSAQKDTERVRESIALIDSGRKLAPKQQTEILQTLETFECWTPYFRLLRRRISDESSRTMDDYIRLARAQSLYLEDKFAAAETCAQLVSDLKPMFAAFKDEVLPKVVEFEDWSTESLILQAVCDRFTSSKDRVACLERLCMLFEKKIHNDQQLAGSYEKLLAVDQRNVKALRYFKLIFAQDGDWDRVVAILRTLLTCVQHRQEMFRVAQEMAAIYLYQLERPHDAIKVLEDHCSDSPLDTSTIHYDAYFRLKNWEGCLRVLRQCLISVDDDSSRAILQYKSGELADQLGATAAAADHFEKAAKLSTAFLEPLEKLITLNVHGKNWVKTLEWLRELEARTRDEFLQESIQQAIKRLEDGIATSGTGT